MDDAIIKFVLKLGAAQNAAAAHTALEALNAVILKALSSGRGASSCTAHATALTPLLKPVLGKPWRADAALAAVVAIFAAAAQQGDLIAMVAPLAVRNGAAAAARALAGASEFVELGSLGAESAVVILCKAISMSEGTEPIACTEAFLKEEGAMAGLVAAARSATNFDLGVWQLLFGITTTVEAVGFSSPLYSLYTQRLAAAATELTSLLMETWDRAAADNGGARGGEMSRGVDSYPMSWILSAATALAESDRGAAALLRPAPGGVLQRAAAALSARGNAARPRATVARAVLLMLRLAGRTGDVREALKVAAAAAPGATAPPLDAALLTAAAAHREAPAQGEEAVIDQCDITLNALLLLEQLSEARAAAAAAPGGREQVLLFPTLPRAAEDLVSVFSARAPRPSGIISYTAPPPPLRVDAAAVVAARLLALGATRLGPGGRPVAARLRGWCQAAKGAGAFEALDRAYDACCDADAAARRFAAQGGQPTPGPPGEVLELAKAGLLLLWNGSPGIRIHNSPGLAFLGPNDNVESWVEQGAWRLLGSALGCDDTQAVERAVAVVQSLKDQDGHAFIQCATQPAILTSMAGVAARRAPGVPHSAATAAVVWLMDIAGTMASGIASDPRISPPGSGPVPLSPSEGARICLEHLCRSAGGTSVVADVAQNAAAALRFLNEAMARRAGGAGGGGDSGSAGARGGVRAGGGEAGGSGRATASAGTGGAAAGGSEAKACSHCGTRKGEGAAGLRRCSACQSVVFCSVECQKAAWPEHKKVCSYKTKEKEGKEKEKERKGKEGKEKGKKQKD